MSKNQNSKSAGWELAVGLIVRYDRKPAKLDSMIKDLPEHISSTDRRICQSLFYGVIRHKRLVEAVIGGLVEKRPKGVLRGVLEVGVMGVIDAAEDTRPKVVDFVVEMAKGVVSKREVGFVNAVMRKVPGALDEMQKGGDLGVLYSHPKWLVKRWEAEFGENVKALLEWNQQVPGVYCRVWEGETSLEKAKWDGFYKAGDWREIEGILGEGRGYVQDPSTRIGPGMVDIKGDEEILDLCAAPGGKGLYFAPKLVAGGGSLVAVDQRVTRLEENLSRVQGLDYKVIDFDLMELGEIGEFDGVFVDVPCSNTGVIQRRPDVKWRLEVGEIERIAGVQLELLRKAATYVKSGGWLIYSTCSIEAAENGDVIDAFLADASEFKLEQGQVHYPWDTGHDGCGAYLLRKS